MTLVASAPIEFYTIAGATTPLGFDHSVENATDLAVYAGNVRQVLGTDYTVDIADNFNSAVITPTAAAVSSQWTIFRDMPMDQDTALPSDLTERGMDRIMRRMQGLRTLLDRTMQFDPAELRDRPITITELPEGHFYIADADGNMIDGGDASGVGDAAAAATAAELAAAQAAAAASAAANSATAADAALAELTDLLGDLTGYTLLGPYTVGGATQSVNTGIPTLGVAQATVFQDHWPLLPTVDYAIASGVITPVGGDWDVSTIYVKADIAIGVQDRDVVPTEAYGANSQGGTTDLVALENLIATTEAELPRLQKWAQGSIMMSSLVPGPDNINSTPFFKRIIEAGIPQGKRLIVDATRAWLGSSSRPSGLELGPTGEYVTIPKSGIDIEFAREFDATEWAPLTTGPLAFRYDAVFGTAVPVAQDMLRGTDRKFYGGPSAATLFPRGKRCVIYNTAHLTDLIGAFTLVDLQGSPYCARSEVCYTEHVDDDDFVWLEAPVKDNYLFSSGAAPYFRAYEDDGDIRITNPMWRGSGASMVWQGLWVAGATYAADDGVLDASGSWVATVDHVAGSNFTTDKNAGKWSPAGLDRLFRFFGARSLLIEGGKIENVSGTVLGTSSIGTMVVRDLVVLANDKRTNAIGGVFYTGGTTTGALFDNVETHGGAQPFMTSATGDDWGVTDGLVYRDCRAFGPGSHGFSQHNMEKNGQFVRCRVEGSLGSGFDIRSAGSSMLDCKARRIAGTAVVLRNNLNNITIDGLYVRTAATGINIIRFGGAEPPDYAPSGIHITNCNLYDIGDVGSAGPINLIHDLLNPDLSVPVCGDVHVKNCHIDITGNYNGITIAGGWDLVDVVDNTFSGGTSFGRAVVIREAGDNIRGIAYDAQTGNFAIGEHVTQATSGASGYVQDQTDSGTTGILYIYLDEDRIEFVDNKLITGSIAGSAMANIPGNNGTVGYKLIFGKGANNIIHRNSAYPPTIAAPIVQAESGRRVDEGHIVLGVTSSLQQSLTVDQSLSIAHVGMTFNTTGAVVQPEITISMSVTPGLKLGPFYVTSALGLKLRATTNDTFRIGTGSASPANGYIATAVQNEWIELEGTSNNTWMVRVFDPANYTMGA